jgi:hypothetical protein
MSLFREEEDEGLHVRNTGRYVLGGSFGLLVGTALVILGGASLAGLFEETVPTIWWVAGGILAAISVFGCLIGLYLSTRRSRR